MLDESEVMFRVRLKGDNYRVTRQAAQGHPVMCDPDPRTRPKMRGYWPFLALLMVLAFLAHDIMMVVPVSAVDAGESASALIADLSASHAVAPHPDNCQVGQMMVLERPAPRLPHLMIALVAQLRMTRPGPSQATTAVTQARSPTAHRAVLQVFRL